MKLSRFENNKGEFSIVLKDGNEHVTVKVKKNKIRIISSLKFSLDPVKAVNQADIQIERRKNGRCS